ncbi:MAG: Unknown protein, partial [uncultured Sulfurovum sp.]
EEMKNEILNSTAVKMLDQKMQEYEEILESREAELDLNWKSLESYFDKAISAWTTKVCGVSERCRNDIASGNEGDSTPILAGALLTVIGNIDMRFTIAIEILKGAALAMKSEECNNLASFNHKWQESLEKQTIHFVQFKGYLYAKYKILDPASELKNMDEYDIQVIIDKYLEVRLCSNKDMSRMYTDAWLASTKDKDTGYWGTNDNDAGYIVIVMTYIYPTVFLSDLDKIFTHGTWQYKAYIDDVEKPAGTKQRLVNQFNGGTKLVDLPYKVVVEIQQGTKHMKCRFQKNPEGVWSTEMGPPQLINTWKEQVQNTLTLNHLSAE